MWKPGRIVAFCLLLCAAAPPGSHAQDRALRGAWVADEVGLLEAPSGDALEPRLLDLLGERADLAFSLQRLSRADAAAELAAGRLDFILPASPEPGAELLLSQPYGSRTDALVCHKGLPAPEGTGDEPLRQALARGWRVAVSPGESFGPELDTLLAAPERSGQVLRAGVTGENLDAVLSGRIECLLAPRLALFAALAASPRDEGFHRAAVGSHALHIRFNPETVSPAIVAEVDQVLRTLRDDGTLDELAARAARPILLRFAVATSWFSWFDILGTVAFALSGVLIARREGYSLLGAGVLAALPAVGGGLLRDLIVGRRPVGILADPLPLCLVGGTVLGAFLVFKTLDRLHRLRARRSPQPLRPRWPRILTFGTLLEVTDAMGLAAFTVIGVVVAVRSGAEPLWLWGPLCAALSGAGGGILRDVLRASQDNPALRTSFYAEVCVVWGLALSLAVTELLREEHPVLLRLVIGLTVLGAFATRLAVVLCGIRSPRF